MFEVELAEMERRGKLAYEAYCEVTGWKSAITGASLPPFDKCPDAVRSGWIAAANVVFRDTVEQQRQ